ncbi:ParB/RepB/Spo0J family partition protein [Rhodococcus sp. 1R11]|uniref:ParB/RepB/Spo0J family partition protein n=1 Tax=Rhodococcus sp. 1R11 TaxID=2559614 RepID=UPI001071D607|nr:ParB/RepB/Spo0J family partition protein [Rhodococcus sp. 1R11]TFI40929.1 ParB/RepB/Spo0J family partition protein [Rhodococcus sp. 1R11]
MTASIETTTAATEAPTTGTTPVVGAGEEFARLHPTTLDVGPNVRDHVDTDSQDFRDLVASVVVHGVVQAISAVRDGENVVVIDGQQRTLAAIEAGVDSVPVLIRTAVETFKEREIERISKQVVTNDLRTPLTEGQRAKAFADMLALGVSVPKIAKSVQVKRETVKAGAAAGRSQTALEALDAGQLDLEQAAVVALFDADGDDEAVEELLNAGSRFRSVAQELIADRAERKARAEAGTPYADKGLTVLADEPFYDSPYVAAEDLVTADGDPITEAVIDAAAEHWAVWLTPNEQITLTATGEVIESESIDWATEGAPKAVATEGYHHHKDVTVAQVWVPEYFTADPDAAGVKLGPILAAASSEPDEADDQAAAERKAREKKAAQAALAAKEAEKATRRRTVALNKASAAATIVRKEWLTKFLTRKTLPKGAGKWITETLVDEPGLLTENKAAQYLTELLGVTVPADTSPSAGYPGVADKAARRALAATIDKTPSETRAQVILLAQILAAYEARVSGKGNDSWRRTAWGNQDNYLGFLDQHGHVLTVVEQAAAGMLTPEQAYDALTAPSEDNTADQ